MAQSYDVYYARMLLTLGLVEREKLQNLLRTFQQIPGAKGFSKYLVEQRVLDVEAAKKVATELEKYLLERRARQLSDRGGEARSAPAEGSRSVPQGAQRPLGQRAEGEVARPLGGEAPRLRSSGTHTPLEKKKPRSSAVHPALAPEPAASHAPPPPPPPPLPAAPPPLPSMPAPLPSIPAPPSVPAPPRVGSGSSADRRAPHPPAKPGRESARLKKSGDPDAAPAGRESARLKKSGEVPLEPPPTRESQRLHRSAAAPEPQAPAPPATASAADRQRALFDRATKDPLAKLVGRRLGRTEVTKLVETGPSVTVFEGKHGDDERPALVKVLRPDRVKDRAALERFSREAKALEKIDHPNIARVFETGEAEKVRFLSIEASTGEVLSELLERAGRLPPERVQKIGRATALGLAAAHRAAIIHRDVRPANIYIEEDGTVKISGFGLARDVEVPGRLTATGQITGHPSYVAPEIAAGEELTGKADVYSLGIVLYLAIAGRLPFESRSVVKLVGMQMNMQPPALQAVAPGTPPKLAQAVEKLLAKSPAKRPDAMEAATLLGAKDLLEGGSEASDAVAAASLDPEEELRRMLAPDEDQLSSEEPIEPGASPISGPSCASCELPLGAKAVSLHGNSICVKCLERVEALDVCAACFQELSGSEAGAQDAAVFAGHCYCRACTARVKLACGACGKPVGLADLPAGRARAKGDQLVHASCP